MSTVPLVIKRVGTDPIASMCDDIAFYQVGSMDIPTYSADGKYFCMGRTHEYSITKSLSGVQYTCILELK